MVGANDGDVAELEPKRKFIETGKLWRRLVGEKDSDRLAVDGFSAECVNNFGEGFRSDVAGNPALFLIRNKEDVGLLNGGEKRSKHARII